MPGNRERFLLKVPDRGEETLIQQIKPNIEPESRTISDSWKGYSTSELEKAVFTHLKENHKNTFVDPETGASTQRVERMWGSAKWRNRVTSHPHLHSYLVECMWLAVVKPKGRVQI